MREVGSCGRQPWKVLEEYRGRYYEDAWPTLPQMFRISCERFGERPCLTIYEPDRISLSYNEARDRAEAIARWLHAKGIRRGDKVAVTGKNSPEWAAAYLGVLFSGATVVPIDYQLKDEETELLVKTVHARILFVDEEKFDRFRDKGLEEVISLKRGIGTYVYDLDGLNERIEDAKSDDLAAILFTSGTMGNPKGVMLTHENLVSDCYLAQGHLNLFPTDVFYALLPVHHAYTMLAVIIESWSIGAEIVFGKRMVTSQILRDLKQAKITMLLAVPLLFNKVLAGIIRGIKEKGPVAYALISFLMIISGLIKKLFRVNPGKKLFGFILEKASLNTLRIGICGGGPLAPSVFRKYNQLGIDFIQGYGLTETSPIIALNPKEHYKETSVGRVLPYEEMKILNPDERGVGEVIVKGPMVMPGYFEMPAETAEVFTEDGFLKTGDLGYLDSEDYLYLTGRAKNMIVTEGGKNVYPEEIENEFQLFEEVDQILIKGYQKGQNKSEHIEALVYPSADFKWNDSGEAAIKARIEAVVSEVNTRLLPYQRIERVEILKEPLEMTTTKKIKR
ncbi:MAG: AMP-binding protein [Treponema sp.]|jgi:long-chain acyl-CoA synthetase|nr:AMP-binding protein [Treponema sp.]